jgi:hypothetical protein
MSNNEGKFKLFAVTYIMVMSVGGNIRTSNVPSLRGMGAKLGEGI